MIICSDTMAFCAEAANGHVEQIDATENETGVLTDAQSDQTEKMVNMRIRPG